MVALVEAALLSFELGNFAFEGGGQVWGLMRGAKIYVGDGLEEAIAAADVEGEVGEEWSKLKFGGMEVGFHDELEPETKFGDVDGPIHYVNAVELVADDAAAALVGRFFFAEGVVGAGLQIIEHQNACPGGRSRSRRLGRKW